MLNKILLLLLFSVPAFGQHPKWKDLDTNDIKRHLPSSGGGSPNWITSQDFSLGGVFDTVTQDVNIESGNGNVDIQSGDGNVYILAGNRGGRTQQVYIYGAPNQAGNPPAVVLDSGGVSIEDGLGTRAQPSGKILATDGNLNRGGDSRLLWTSLTKFISGTPSTYSSPIVVDTTGHRTFFWNGSAYIIP